MFLGTLKVPQGDKNQEDDGVLDLPVPKAAQIKKTKNKTLCIEVHLQISFENRVLLLKKFFFNLKEKT